MLFGKRQERLPLQAKCRKGKPCGAICIPKGSSCREGKRTGDNEVTRYNQEYIASLFTQSVNPWTGQPDFQKFRSLPRVEQQKALKSAYRWLEDAKVEKKTRKDASAGADGKCGPGWKPGPGGKCVRTKRAIVKRVAVGAGLLAAGAAGAAGYHNRESISEGAAGVSSAVQGGVQGAKAGVKKALRDRAVRDRAQKVEQKAYDKGFSSRMSESFEPKVANFQGRKSAMEAREKFERRAGKRGDSELSRLDGPRSMVDGKCVASLSRKNNKDSLMDDYYSEIAQIIEYSQGIRVDSIYDLEDQGSSLIGIASSGGDFFEFEIDSRSTGVAPRPDLTHSANERARGALSAMGISYRGDSAYEFLCGMEFREDNLGQSAKAAIGRVKSAVMGGVNRVKQAMGSKPPSPAPAAAPSKKRKVLKTIGKIAATGAGIAGSAALYKNRNEVSSAVMNAGSKAKRKALGVAAAAQVARSSMGNPMKKNVMR